MRAFLDRLFPSRLRQRAKQQPEENERTQLWARVPDNDRCLAAVQGLLGDMLEGNFAQAGNPENSPQTRLTAAERASIARQIMNQIEDERAQAKEWAKTQPAFNA